MKKIFYLCITVAVMLASCAKQTIDTNAIVPTHNVSFNIQNFNSEVVNYPTNSKGTLMSVNNATSVVSGTSLSTYVNNIAYVIFNDKGVKVKDSVQTVNDKDFGKLNFQLRDGSYKLMLAAGSGKLTGTQTAFYLNGISYLGEQFYKQIDFSVASKDVNYDATLNRMGAKLIIKLTQAWPDAVKNVTFKLGVENRLNFIIQKGENSLGTAYPEYVFGEKAESRLLESSWFSAMFPGETRLKTGVLTAYGANNEVLYQRTIDQIQMEYNKITTLTGNLFTSKISGFTVQIDADWAGNINQTF